MWTILDRFVIDEDFKAREGGMAEVYRAVDMKREGKKVAVKLFRQGIEKLELTRAAFSRELGALIELGSHPNIVNVLEHGTDAKTDRQFIVLDWIEDDLSHFIGPQLIKGWDDFYERFGRQILEALSFAHSRRFIHRDVKPSNILIDENENVLVADFGISKFMEYYGAHLTLRDFASLPYAPPERDSGEFENTKDVHAFAVLALECVVGRELQNHEDVKQAFGNEFDGPDEVIEIIGEALDQRPSARPNSSTELLDRIEESQRERRSYWIDYETINIMLTDQAKNMMYAQLSETSEHRVVSFIEEDIAEIFGIEKVFFREIDKWVEAPDRYSLIGASFNYQIVVSKLRDFLWLNKATKLPSADLDYRRERAWKPENLKFRIGRPMSADAGRSSIAYLVEGVASHEVVAKLEKEKRKGEELYFKWDSILRFKEELEEKKETPIKFRDASAVGNHIRLISSTALDEDVAGQARYVDLKTSKLSGEIESCDGNEILFYPHDSSFASFPESGLLIFDTRLSRQSIRRQKYALDAIKYGRAVRPDLREALLDPKGSGKPDRSGKMEFFDKDLDEDKREALKAALGTEDFLIVEGPPGTGKTKFISELVLQEIKRNPKSRILLSSQTNIALDNALERIRQMADNAGLGVKLVRIGRWGDPRISKEVEDLLLESGVHQWLETVRLKSEQFLGDWAENRGVSRENVVVGIAMQKLMHAKIELEYSDTLEKNLAKKISELELLIGAEGNELTSDRFTEAKDKLELTQDEHETARFRLGQARKAVAESSQNLLKFSDELGEEIADYSPRDLEMLAEDFIGQDKDGKKLRKLIEIEEEWLDRFGHSEDFYSAFVVEAQVVAGTCIGFAGRGLQDVEYDLCIVDEASKATINEVLVPISRSNRWIIVGDPRQLPPFVGYAIDYLDLLEKYSIDQNDIKSTILDYFESTLPSEQQKTLTKQYRMTRAIGDLVSHCFYKGSLKSVNDKQDQTLQKAQAFPRPVTWFSTSGMKNTKEFSCRPSFKNLAEVELVQKLLLRIDFAGKSGDRDYTVAVLAGYGAQITELRRMTANISEQLTNVKVSCNTVDSFQGRQTDIAIYSVTRSNDKGQIGFLKEIERLNVALSRGRYALGIVGDEYFCRGVRGQNPFSDVLAYIAQNPEDCTVSEYIP